MSRASQVCEQRAAGRHLRQRRWQGCGRGTAAPRHRAVGVSGHAARLDEIGALRLYESRIGLEALWRSSKRPQVLLDAVVAVNAARCRSAGDLLSQGCPSARRRWSSGLTASVGNLDWAVLASHCCEFRWAEFWLLLVVLACVPHVCTCRKVHSARTASSVTGRLPVKTTLCSRNHR